MDNCANIKYNINSKIKLPFEFLSVFYGMNFDNFINLLISIISFDFENGKFSIEHNNFIAKLEKAKILYDFYNESSYFHSHKNNRSLNKECFLFDWDVRNIFNNELRRFAFKILLPQMKVVIKSYDKTKIKFFSTLNIKKMGDLIKNSFNKWDYYILLIFSELKIFRYEINKVLCGKYKSINKYNEIQFKKEKKEKIFNLNRKILILNNIKKNDLSYGMFYSHKKINNENENYYINLKLPQIKISYQNILDSFHKKFDVDITRLSQLHKLKKFFCPEDIIKYSMDINWCSNREKKPYIEAKKSHKLLPLRTTIRSLSKRSYSVIHKNTITPSKLKIKKLKIEKEEGTNGKIKFNRNRNKNDEFIKDIQLNLDKYIFNFDESILKYIKVNENNKNNRNQNNPINNKNFEYKDSQKKIDIINNGKRLDIEIGTFQLSWINQDALSKNIQLNKKDSEYLLDFPTSKWRFFVEKNIEKILVDDKNLIQPVGRSSKKKFYWKDFITKKET